MWASMEIVKEDSPDPSRFAAMRDVEIYIAPFLESGVERRRKGITCGFVGLVEVGRVGRIEVGRRQV